MLNNHNSGLMLPPLKQMMEVTKCPLIKFCYVIRIMQGVVHYSWTHIPNAHHRTWAH